MLPQVKCNKSDTHHSIIVAKSDGWRIVFNTAILPRGPVLQDIVFVFFSIRQHPSTSYAFPFNFVWSLFVYVHRSWQKWHFHLACGLCLQGANFPEQESHQR